MLNLAQLVPSLLVAVVAAVLAAWLAPVCAFKRFQREKEWERKVEAYTAIFDALHDMTLWDEEHWDSLVNARDIPQDRESKLAADSQQAKARLARRLASEVWLIPEVCRVRLEKMTEDLRMEKADTWSDVVDNGCGVPNTTVSELRALIRHDLGFDRGRRRHRLWLRREEGNSRLLHLFI